MSYVISELKLLLMHSPGGTVESLKNPLDITASNTSNNGNEHLPNISLNQLQKVATMIRHNYSTTELTYFLRDLFLKASYRRKLLWSVHLFQINLQEIILTKTVKTVILLTTAEIEHHKLCQYKLHTLTTHIPVLHSSSHYWNIIK
jgi:hypothetical protein